MGLGNWSRSDSSGTNYSAYSARTVCKMTFDFLTRSRIISPKWSVSVTTIPNGGNLMKITSFVPTHYLLTAMKEIF